MSGVLITGGAGFIGSHVAEAVSAGGERPVVIDDLSTGRRTNLPDAIGFHQIDIRDRAKLLAVARAQSDVRAIVHCAAQVSVVASTEDPAFDVGVNLLGTLNVLELAETLSVPLVFTSTGGAIYGSDAPRPTPEDTPIAPASPYGASKAAAEIYIRMAAAATGLPHAICRLGNVYGPRQRSEGEAGVVAILSSRLHVGEEVKLYGDGTPTRDYVHAVDVARALLMAVGKPVTVNIATGIETSVDEVFALIAGAVGPNADITPQRLPLRAGEIQHSCLDVSYAANALGWQPQISVAEGIPATARSLIT